MAGSTGSTAGLIEQSKEKFQARLDELRPLVEEFNQVEGILAVFNGEMPRSSSARRRGTTATASRADRGQRPQEFLGLVVENPGITVSQAAEKMGNVQPNYLYRIAKDLTETGLIRKQDKGYHPVSE